MCVNFGCRFPGVHRSENHSRESFLGAGIINRDGEVGKLSTFPDHKLTALFEGVEICRLPCPQPPCHVERTDLVAKSIARLHVRSLPAIGSLIPRYSKSTPSVSYL